MFVLKTVSVAAIICLTGCASVTEKVQRVEAKVEQAIDCKNAQMDIMYLEDARATTQEKLLNGVATILPTTAVLNLISGEYRHRQSIATGKLDDILQQKILAISDHCEIKLAQL